MQQLERRRVKAKSHNIMALAVKARSLRSDSVDSLSLFTEEFQRAVHISTGHVLHPYVVHTVFQLFDKDGESLFMSSFANNYLAVINSHHTG